MREIKAPYRVVPPLEPTIFLAGSVEMGKAANWQDMLVKDLWNQPVTIFNPRRDLWDNSWSQEIRSSQFREQVLWELDHLDLVDMIVLYFDPTTRSPVSLLELGLYADSGKLLICCPEGFYRKGNVDIVAHRYNIPLCDNYNHLVGIILKSLYD